MSELAERERVIKRVWAAPGGAHDHVIRVMKLVLPGAIGVVLAFLAFSPLEEKQEVSFLLDKNKVEHAEERMRVESAQYRGQDDRGRPFVLNARAALQQSSAVPIVDIRDMSAQITLDNGPARLVARQARYDMRDDLTLRAGVTNAFDADPVPWLENTTSDNFDLFGRRFYIGFNYRPY